MLSVQLGFVCRIRIYLYDFKFWLLIIKVCIKFLPFKKGQLFRSSITSQLSLSFEASIIQDFGWAEFWLNSKVLIV